MREKYVLGTFGSCQRILCDRQLVLPIGLSEELSTSRVKVSIFCFSFNDFFKYRHIAQDAKKFTSLDKNISILTVHILALVFQIFYLKPILIYIQKKGHSHTFQQFMVSRYLDKRAQPMNTNMIIMDCSKIKRKSTKLWTIKLLASQNIQSKIAKWLI